MNRDDLFSTGSEAVMDVRNDLDALRDAASTLEAEIASPDLTMGEVADRNQCYGHSVPFFFKNGALNGRDHLEFPEGSRA